MNILLHLLIFIIGIFYFIKCFKRSKVATAYTIALLTLYIPVINIVIPYFGMGRGKVTPFQQFIVDAWGVSYTNAYGWTYLIYFASFWIVIAILYIASFKILYQLTDKTQSLEKNTNQFTGIGGWLILYGFLFIIQIITQISSVFNSLVSRFAGEKWTNITTSGSELYNPLLAIFLIFNLVITIGFIFFAFYLLMLFFKKRKTFPKLVIIYLASNLAFIVINPFVSYSLSQISDPINFTFILRFIYHFVWLTYFLDSKRVKETFYKE